MAPTPSCENGWMWITPSPWVWMPIWDSNVGEVGQLLAADVEGEGLVDVVAELRDATHVVVAGGRRGRRPRA